MDRYLQTTVNLGTVFPNNVLEAFGPQKSSFTVGKLTFLRPEGLQNIFWKNCPKVNCGLQIPSHCKKKGKSQKLVYTNVLVIKGHFLNTNVLKIILKTCKK